MAPNLLEKESTVLNWGLSTDVTTSLLFAIEYSVA